MNGTLDFQNFNYFNYFNATKHVALTSRSLAVWYFIYTGQIYHIRCSTRTTYYVL